MTQLGRALARAKANIQMHRGGDLGRGGDRRHDAKVDVNPLTQVEVELGDSDAIPTGTQGLESEPGSTLGKLKGYYSKEFIETLKLRLNLELKTIKKRFQDRSREDSKRIEELLSMAMLLDHIDRAETVEAALAKLDAMDLSPGG